jgi:hypothetical protein
MTPTSKTLSMRSSLKPIPVRRCARLTEALVSAGVRVNDSCTLTWSKPPCMAEHWSQCRLFPTPPIVATSRRRLSHQHLQDKNIRADEAAPVKSRRSSARATDADRATTPAFEASCRPSSSSLPYLLDEVQRHINIVAHITRTEQRFSWWRRIPQFCSTLTDQGNRKRRGT